MKHLLWLLLFAGAAHAVVNPCPQTSGTLTSPVTSPRLSGISPLLVFFDNSGVTSTNVTTNMTAFQDVQSTWDFGDTLGSGTATWSNGANSGHNLRRYATGNVAAHLYVTEGRDTFYTATITSSDGVNQVSCAVSVHVFDPSGANGFPGAATTCISTSGNFTNCPSGATHVTSSTISLIGGNLSNKRLLYRCGETFSGSGVNITGTKWSVGAYGGCENTKTNRPLFLDNTAGNHIHLAQAGGQPGTTDGRIADIAFQSTAGNAAAAADQNDFGWIKEVTIYNIDSNQQTLAYWSHGVETGIVDSVQSATGGGISLYVNTAETTCLNGSKVFQCGQGSGAQFVPINYNAVMGNLVRGCPGCNNAETMRQSEGRFSIVSNNTLNGAGGSVSNLKFHNGTEGSVGPWLGQYNEYFEISDNFTGPAGGNGIEVAPQNGGLDERLRFGVVERNVMVGNSNAQGYALCWISGQNITLRDNMFRMDSSASLYPQAGCQTNTRGGGNFPTWQTQFLEVYNNSGLVTGTAQSPQALILNAGSGPGGTGSIYKNNLYFASNNNAAVSNVVGGNTVSNNSANSNANPGFTNASGNFVISTDYKPTANFTGGVSVPVKYDAILSATNPYGVAWSPTWDLGAVHH